MRNLAYQLLKFKIIGAIGAELRAKGGAPLVPYFILATQQRRSYGRRAVKCSVLFCSRYIDKTQSFVISTGTGIRR